MSKTKLVLAAVSMVAAMSLAANGLAQNSVPKVNWAGSSGAFNSFALAAGLSTTGTGAGLCGGNNWTKKNGASGADSRGAISNVTANIWVVWNNTADPNRTVCSYLAVDSIVGNRLFFAVPQGTLSIPSTAVGEAGDNLVPLLPPDTPLPQDVYNDLNGAAFNGAPSDIRPEDAAWGSTRALTALSSPPKWTPTNGLGYGPGPIGQTILSAFSTKSSQVVAFNITGDDPITGMPVLVYQTNNVGAQAIMIGVNATDTSSAGLGNAAFNNVDRFVLAFVQNGTLTRTRDLIPSSGLAAVPLHVLNREPLSGTFNTEEYTAPASVEIGSSQENNVNPGSGGNPLNITAADGATRQRVIGNGEMVSEIPLISDSLGYFFWSFGNTAGLVSTSKYLAVDGVDPIYATYTNGEFPTCTAPCPGEVTLPNVVNGSYPLWNVLRVTTVKPTNSFMTSLISAAETQVANIPDFVPNTSLEVFRSHYEQDGIAAQNGHIRGQNEKGGDVGGAVLTVQADLDNITDTGKELKGYKQ